MNIAPDCSRVNSSQFLDPSIIFQKIRPKSSPTVNLFSVFCAGCQQVKMSAIPQGAFAARKVRLNMWGERSLTINHQEKQQQQQKKKSERTKIPQFYGVGDTVWEYTPLKYNSKLMNSIWGMYNKYSVHNFKKNTDAMFLPGGHQLAAAVLPASDNQF